MIAPIGVISLLSAKFFYNNEFDKPALWISLYAALKQKLWGLLLTGLVLGCSVLKKSEL